MKTMKRTAGLLLAAIYLFYFAGTHFFVHRHFVNDRVVVHSHPYSKSNHTHSSIEILSIDELSNDTCVTSDDVHVSEAVCLGDWAFVSATVSAPAKDGATTRRLRAPPLAV
ncbi:MAG: hypothetical protein AUK63_1594 [bacterium P3]|nr:MAG: hypothetical protein AUK63_1594 [bacterium P3]KWW40954.1 MAG: hypothetical protein F083_1298 [bacterium F083]